MTSPKRSSNTLGRHSSNNLGAGLNQSRFDTANIAEQGSSSEGEVVDKFDITKSESKLQTLIEKLVNQSDKKVGGPPDLASKLKLMQDYLRQLNDNAKVGENLDQHIPKRIINVIILDIKVEKKPPSQDRSKKQLKIIPLLDRNASIQVNFSQEIFLQSVVKVRIQYMLDNENLDLQASPKLMEWTLHVKEEQQEMLAKLQRKCGRKLIALPDQKSLINYLMAVLDGERVTARVKQFMCMIQKLTTDYMLSQFYRHSSEKQDQSASNIIYIRPNLVDQDTPPGDVTVTPEIRKDFQKAQQERDANNRVKENETNQKVFAQVNARYKRKQEDALKAKQRREQNLHNFKFFVDEWKHQLAIFFFSHLKDSDMQGYDEKDCFYKSQFFENTNLMSGKEAKQTLTDTGKPQDKQTPGAMVSGLPTEKMYKRQDVMENFRMRILRNLDLAFDIVLDDGFTILKKYDDLKFYLSNMAFGEKYEFLAKQKVSHYDKKAAAVNRKGGKTGLKQYDKNKNRNKQDWSSDSFTSDKEMSFKDFDGTDEEESKADKAKKKKTKNKKTKGDAVATSAEQLQDKKLDLTNLAKHIIEEHAVQGQNQDFRSVNRTVAAGHKERPDNKILQGNDMADSNTAKPMGYEDMHNLHDWDDHHKSYQYGAYRDNPSHIKRITNQARRIEGIKKGKIAKEIKVHLGVPDIEFDVGDYLD